MHLRSDTVSFQPLKALLALILVGSLAGCGTFALGTAREYQAHYLLIHKDGVGIRVPEANPSISDSSDKLDTSQTLNQAELRQQLDRSIRKGIDAHLLRLQQPELMGCRNDTKDMQHTENKKKVLQLLVIIHGGMNGYEISGKHMTDLLKPSLFTPGESAAQPGATAKSDKCPVLNQTYYYPIFINWDSDFGNSWEDDLFRIRFGVRNPWFASLTSPFQLAGRVISSAASAPSSVFHQGFTISEGIRGAAEQGDPAAGIALDTLVNSPGIVLSTALLPFTQGFGAPSWSIMTRRVDEAVSGRLSPDGAPEAGAARTLAYAMRSWITQKDGKWYWGNSDVEVTVTLVGHSMGAMIINRLLEATDTESATEALSSLPISKIVYMAPASSINEAEHLLMPYLERHPTTEFWLFTLNRRDESREIPLKGWLLLVPRGTLLTWIDTFLEDENGPGEGRLGWVRSLREYYGLHPEEIRERGFLEYFSQASSLESTSSAVSPLWRDLHVGWTLTTNPQRLHAYETTRMVGEHGRHPEEHSHFMQEPYLKHVLCMVNSKAFLSPSVCQAP